MQASGSHGVEHASGVGVRPLVVCDIHIAHSAIQSLLAELHGQLAIPHVGCKSVRRPAHANSTLWASTLLPLDIDFTRSSFRVERKVLDTHRHPLLALHEGLSVIIKPPADCVLSSSLIKRIHLVSQILPCNLQPRWCSFSHSVRSVLTFLQWGVRLLHQNSCRYAWRRRRLRRWRRPTLRILQGGRPRRWSLLAYGRWCVP